MRDTGIAMCLCLARRDRSENNQVHVIRPVC